MWPRWRTKPTTGESRLGARHAKPGDEVPQSRPAAQPPHDVPVSSADLDWRDSSALVAVRPAIAGDLAGITHRTRKAFGVGVAGFCLDCFAPLALHRNRRPGAS